jgi:hypothetical protein
VGGRADGAAVGELVCVAHEVQQRLAQPHLVGMHRSYRSIAMDCGPISLWPFGSTSQTESPSIITFCLGFALDLAHKGLVVSGALRQQLNAKRRAGLGALARFARADRPQQHSRARSRR